MKLTAQQESAQKEIVSLAKQAVQLTALRLNLAKQEEDAKKKIDALMSEHGFNEVDGNVTMDGRKVSITVEKKETQVSSLDVDKLAGMLTPEQFKQCAKVTQTDAKKVLPQALIDKCIVVGEPRVSYAVKADKGFPVPEVKLFR
jgi:hypothetical protein